MATNSTNFRSRIILLGLVISIAAALYFITIWHTATPAIQLVILGTGLLISGIPHGALDHLVQEQTFHLQQRHFSLLRFLLMYLLQMITYALLWYLLPQVSLILFLIFSAYHFGETDIAGLKGWPGTLLQSFYGLALLLLLLLSHPDSADSVIRQLVPVSGWFYNSWYLLTMHAATALKTGWIIVTISLTASTLINPVPARFTLPERGSLLLLIVLCCQLPLLLGFILYFAGWHSMVTLLEIQAFGACNRSQFKLSLTELWLKALPFTLLAFVGLSLLIYMCKLFAPALNWLPLLFVFISLITLPHLNVMREMYKFKR